MEDLLLKEKYPKPSWDWTQFDNMSYAETFEILNKCSSEIKEYICHEQQNDNIINYIIKVDNQYLMCLPLNVIQKNINEIATTFNLELFNNIILEHNYDNFEILLKEIFNYHFNVLHNYNILYELNPDTLVLLYYIYYKDFAFESIEDAIYKNDNDFNCDNLMYVIDRFLNSKNYLAISGLITKFDINENTKEFLICDNRLYYSLHADVNDSFLMTEFTQLIENLDLEEDNIKILGLNFSILFDLIKPSKFSYNLAKFIHKFNMQTEFSLFVQAKWNNKFHNRLLMFKSFIIK